MTNVSSGDGFTIIAGTPMIRTNGTLEVLDNDLATLATTWFYETDASIGYDKGSITINPYILDTRDWMNNGLGRHIIFKSPIGKTLWVGFVNQIDWGKRSTGPLLDITNSVNVEYTKIDPSTSIPLHGVPKETGFIDDTDSQNLYGIFSKVLAGGSITDLQATQRANRFLLGHAWPAQNDKFQLRATGLANFRLSLLGYYHWLFYDYTDTSTGTVAVDQKLQDVITADPNGILSTDFDQIDTNATLVPTTEDETRDAAGIIKGLVLDSDSSYNRYTFGIYDRKAYYKQIVSPIEIEYFLDDQDPANRIYGQQDLIVDPWDVEVGKWYYSGSREPGAAFGSTTWTSRDPNVHFLERLKFSMPLDVAFQAGQVLGLNERIAEHSMFSGAQR